MEFAFGIALGLLLSALILKIESATKRSQEQREEDDINDTVQDILEVESENNEEVDLNDPVSIRDHIPPKTFAMATQHSEWSYPPPEPLNLTPHEFKKWTNDQERLRHESKKIKAKLLKRYSDEEFDKLVPIAPNAEQAVRKSNVQVVQEEVQCPSGTGRK